MSRAESFDVIVIGAGVVGASAALALARDGRRVALVEAHEPAPWQPGSADLRVFAFAPDNAALLQSLAVWPKVLSARAQVYRRMRVWDAAAGGELAFDADELGRDCLGWIVENALLVDRLWQALGHEANVRRHCPDRLAALQNDADRVSVSLSSGVQLSAPLAVAADGAASRVREQLGIACAVHDYQQRALVAYVRTALPHQDTAWQRFLPSGPLAFLPCRHDALPESAPGHVSSIVWTLPEHAAQRLAALDPADFCRELTRSFDARLGEVQAVSTRASFPLRRQLAREYVVGRVLLAGDAAHAVHPLAGQGVNLGLRDVAALRGLLAKAGNRDIGAAHRLAQYQRQRRSENTLAAYSFEAINRAFSNDALLPTLLRGPLLGLGGRIAPLRQWLAAMAIRG
ncbi:MAG: 2-octaprenyl-3-methyl-6-methoxy-1,4-benzoquinol hydroxylase [Gammaproteobacteria bacterium HGW-Gammaproteobacteria-1]|jgi:2-octaprenyl-3-methyl-6-methoxy-1,4-benzoquinol hydroxylase|nr:MAG: 2-octaprenyl-3-methyl-6-methoxy-1,4-benzoquinol hydroxylase [Gammaproteobacteria bacterium HGW-Gammaproteobacteria-2]PKM42121.1 MAG: 2-octaprenyl-3-methyl-6-methoxy-1,4-benzoquinol hydroxylase [Gammaproteobacteria bacterium HGW-Gammaproteobacteria-1]